MSVFSYKTEEYRRKMLKYIWLIIIFCVVGAVVQAQKDAKLSERQNKDSLMRVLGNIPAFTIYKDNYIITGTSFSGGEVTKYNSDIKFQISLRHRLHRNLLPFGTYFFLTYTQKSFWDIYRKSAPFAENNYNPTLGVGRHFIFDDRLKWIGMMQFEHESNGLDSVKSRSWNRLTFTGIYLFNRNYSFQAKMWIAMAVSSKNKQITRYLGIGQMAGTYIDNSERFTCSALMIKRGGWNLNANWRLEVAYRLFRAGNQYLFLQFFNGYGESMIDYNEFQRYLRIGFVIKPNSVTIF